MRLIWTLIVSGIIGAITGAITNGKSSMGAIANIITDLVDSAIGQALLGAWEPTIAEMAIIPSLIGAIILVLIISFLARKL